MPGTSSDSSRVRHTVRGMSMKMLITPARTIEAVPPIKHFQVALHHRGRPQSTSALSISHGGEAASNHVGRAPKPGRSVASKLCSRQDVIRLMGVVRAVTEAGDMHDGRGCVEY